MDPLFSSSSGLPSRGLFGAVIDFFLADEWQFDIVEGESRLNLMTGGDSGNWRCTAVVDPAAEQFAFFSICDTTVPVGRRSAAAEYLTRANYGLSLGNFEMDFADGEVRVRTSVDVEGGTLTETMIKNVVYTNCALMDRYLPGLLRVVFGLVPPEEAVGDVERAA